MSREPVTVEHRIAPSVGWKIAILAKSQGCCSYPECSEREGLEFDHVIPRALGGKHRLDNYQALCPSHHLAKTKLDVKLIAKAKRLERKDVGQPRKSSRLQGRGFSKTHTRHFDGTVSRRSQPHDQ